MLPQSNSTSRLDPTKKDALLNPLDAAKRQPASVGRFSILDERCKSYLDDSSDSEDEVPSTVPVFSKQKQPTDKKFSKSVDFTHSPSVPHLHTSGSRFKIVPVESRYKRGRWNCYDFYDKEVAVAKTPKLSCPSTMTITKRPEVVPYPVQAPRTAPPTQVTFGFELGSDSDRENTSPHASVQRPNPISTVPRPAERKIVAVVNQRDSPSKTTPSDVLQNGLENTLSTDLTGNKTITTKKSHSTTSNNATTSQMVAIDSKIEQAMDLVKTHLMFAVREEVDVLKARIGDLEQHVIHLEAENSILRDYIPEDILKKLNIHQK